MLFVIKTLLLSYRAHFSGLGKGKRQQRFLKGKACPASMLGSNMTSRTAASSVAASLWGLTV